MPANDNPSTTTMKIILTILSSRIANKFLNDSNKHKFTDTEAFK